MKAGKNKWICGALPALLTHLSIGSVYAWSVLSKPAAAELSVSYTTLSWAFSIAIFFVGFSAAFSGKYIDKIGPKKTLVYSALFYGGGLLLSALALYMKNVYLLFAGYGMIGGLGIGLGYLAPMKTLLQWFSDKKGLATGIAVMGFGFSSFLAAPVINILIEQVGIVLTLVLMGAVYVILILLAAYLITPMPEAMQNPDKKETEATTGKTLSISLEQALHRKEFYALWFIFFINILAGISLISNASILIQDQFQGISAMAAANIVGIMAVCNGAGRLLWSALSDYTGRPVIYSGILLLQIFLFIALNQTNNLIIYQLLLFIIISCYGAGFACMPAYIADLFGLRHVNAIFGAMLTAWGIAGALGGWLIAWIRETTHSYDLMIYLMAGTLSVALLASFIPWVALKKKT